MKSYLTHLDCPKCRREYAKGRVLGLCECGSPLLARYGARAAAAAWPRESLRDRPPSMWRYAEMLPAEDAAAAVSLGEGWTPLIHASRLGRELGVPNLYIKDESLNPTASFKARGLSAAVSMARSLGLRKLAIPSAGNAAGALAAYAARAGMEAHIFMPRDTPKANILECAVFGARVELVDGLITDCGRIVAQRREKEGWFDVSTLKEPYRIEGKKTLGYEIAEQFDWRLPDAIVYPTGGGTGLIGMWKAFGELEEMGWIGPARPRMVTVQAAGCAPIVRAFHAGEAQAAVWENVSTIASGLRVPRAIGDFLMLEALRRSHGTAASAEDGEMVEAIGLCGRLEGLYLCPEGAACIPALRRLREAEWLGENERVVVVNTAGGLKYPEALEGRVVT